jgi:hypothetical protein
VIVPFSTACVPWYSPHSMSAAFAMITNATSAARARVRRTPVANAVSVEPWKRCASRPSAA